MAVFLLNVVYGLIKFLMMNTVQNCSTSYVNEFVGFFIGVGLFVVSAIISEYNKRKTALMGREEIQNFVTAKYVRFHIKYWSKYK